MYGHRARQLGVTDHGADVFLLEALFTTVTNVNFDAHKLAEMIWRAATVRDRVQAAYAEAYTAQHGTAPASLDGPAAWLPEHTFDALVRQGEAIGLDARQERFGADVTALQELTLYGLKGMAAYADHALVLGKEDDSVYAFFHEALDFLAKDAYTVAELVAMTLKVGEVNLTVMEILDAIYASAKQGRPIKIG